MLNKEVKHIDISNTPELIRLAEEVQESNQVTVLTKDGEEVLEVRPAKPAGKKRVKRAKFTKDDAMFRLIGVGKSNIPGGVSGKKHEYLAQTYRQSHS